MIENIPYLHRLKADVSGVELPARFTFPFSYDPHPLSIIAAQELQNYLSTQTDFDHNFGLGDQTAGAIGKMFGVLVVRTQEGQLSYLAACSGKLAGSNRHRFFVPPVFDMLDPDGFFLAEEEQINRLNREIELLEHDPTIGLLKMEVEQIVELNREELAKMRQLHKANKAERRIVRQEEQKALSADAYQWLEEDLIKQSYRDQHEYAVLRDKCKIRLAHVKEKLDERLGVISDKKNLRKAKSAALQNRLFDEYQFLNARGERRSLLSIFEEAIHMLPPAGAGECAAPKLLQYAYQHQLQPVCMAEFWWGASPASEVRKHGYFYPSCRGKCEPILGHMLQGLEVDPNPMLENAALDIDFEIIFEDEDLIVINKPAELLSVPGIHVQDSVQTRILARYPDITGPLIIHRLDMSTSGILVLAKHKEAHRIVQDQFIKHQVYKRYSALLDGVIQENEGTINLLLRVDLDDRPRQVVCTTYGKPAQTLYRVVGIEGGRTRIHFFPKTGRTHQLRVHAAHRLGLNTPIVGDDLYGKRSNRLHLHAGALRFIHPRTGQEISFEIKDPF